MDFVCAMLFHSNVNKVSPNRTILAGEKVGIAWLLPNEPGVYWYGVFSQLFCGYDLCRFEHAYIALHVMLASLCKKYFAMKTYFPVLCSDSWSPCPAPTDSPREVSEILHRCCKPIRVHQIAGSGPLVIRREQMCCCPLKPALSRMIYRQQ